MGRDGPRFNVDDGGPLVFFWSADQSAQEDVMTTSMDSIKLLIADDHLVLRQALSEALGAKGRYTVIGEAQDGASLLQVLGTLSPDVIILDLEMPNVGGLATLEELSRRGVQVPILVLSANDEERSVRAALKAGAKGFVPKNAGLTELEFAIDAVLKGKTYLSPAITEQLMKDGEIDNSSPFTQLSKRELEILTLLANGKKNKEIGQMLHISTRTVDTHRSNILKKLSVRTNAELVRLAITHGVISA